MADNIEHQDKGELVANCDRFNSLKHSAVRSYAFTEQGVAMLSTVLRSENRNSCKHTNYGCICCNETFHGDKCRSFSTSFNNGVPSTRNAATLARIRQAYRRSVTESFLAIIHNNNNIVSPLYNKNNSNEKDINGHCGYFNHD